MVLQDYFLDGGSRITCLRPEQIPDLQQQVKQYFKHGISLRPGDTVFDVGANIGLFTLMAYEICRGDVRAFAFEPIPVIFTALEENVRRTDPDRLKAFCFGLAERDGSAVFAYHPNMPTLSSAYRDGEQELRDQLQQAILRNIRVTGKEIRWIRWLPRIFQRRILDRVLERLFAAEDVTCTLRTASGVIREHGLTRIDLLKIDVEKGELDVLHGIEAEDWPKIQQVVMELHDLDGRSAAVQKLLRLHGFDDITVEQEPALKGSNVYVLYARRSQRS